MVAGMQAALPRSMARPLHRVRERIRRYWIERLPLRDTTVLNQRNVYILPTRPGFMLGATLLVLLVASINYQLNLGYLLTFLLAGSGAGGSGSGGAERGGTRRAGTGGTGPGLVALPTNVLLRILQQVAAPMSAWM